MDWYRKCKINIKMKYHCWHWNAIVIFYLQKEISTRKKWVLTEIKGGNTMKLVPLSDRVVLKQLEADETTKSWIILTSSAQEKPQEAEVIAVGPGGMVDGKEVKMQVTVGQKVIYSKYAGTEVKLDGEEYIIVRQNDILAVVE